VEHYVGTTGKLHVKMEGTMEWYINPLISVYL